MYRFLSLLGLLMFLSACQTTRPASECNEDFVNEVVAGPYCMEIKVKRSREKFEGPPRAYFLFPGDGNSYKNFSYWDGLYNRLSKKEEFGNTDVLLITVKYPSKRQYIKPIDNEKQKMYAMGAGIKKILERYSPKHIEFWGQSGGGMRAIFTAALSPDIGVNNIRTFNSPCDVASYTSRTIKVDNPYALMDPKDYLSMLPPTTVLSFFGAKNDHLINFEADNAICLGRLENSGYAIEYFHEFKAIGHTNLKDSPEYLRFNQTIIDPDYDPGIPRYMSKEEVARRLTAAKAKEEQKGRN